MTAVSRVMFGRLQALIAIALLSLLLVNPAMAQSCPSPYATFSSQPTGPVCGTTCSPGTFPTMKTGALTCEPGLAPATCSAPDEFLVMTPDGTRCEKGYPPIEAGGAQPACNSGDVRVQRTVYKVGNRQLADLCYSSPNCPSGYIETEDTDANF